MQAYTDNLDLQLLRKRAGITQEEIAEAFGTSASTISKFETGRLTELPDGSARSEYEAAIRRLAAPTAAKAGAK